MRDSRGWTIVALAVAFAIPTLATSSVATAETDKTDKTEAASASSDGAISKEDQAKLKEHNKLRTAIAHVKYPASKADVVAHVKGIKPADKKWFEETLPERTYDSANEVMSALGWEIAPPSDDKTVAHQSKSGQTKADGKSEKTTK